MKVFFILIFSLIHFKYLMADGGRDAGNGGNALVCRGSDLKIQTAELLDYYEARTLRGIKIDPKRASLNLNEDIRFLLNKLNLFSPVLSNQLKIDSNRFFDQTLFLQDQMLIPINDSEHISVPADKNCKIEQVAIQKKPAFPEDKTFYINKEIWDHLDTQNKTGLILHELLLKESLKFGHTTSVSARYFNSVLGSDVFDQYKFQDYVKLLNHIEFNQIDIGGFNFEFESCHEKISTGILTFYSKIIRFVPCTNPQLPRKIHANKMIFDSNGDIEKIELKYPSWFFNSNNQKIVCNSSKKPYLINFGKDRNIESMEGCFIEKIYQPNLNKK